MADIATRVATAAATLRLGPSSCLTFPLSSRGPVPTCMPLGLGFTLTSFVFLCCSDEFEVKLPIFFKNKILHLIYFRITQGWRREGQWRRDQGVHVSDR